MSIKKKDFLIIFILIFISIFLLLIITQGEGSYLVVVVENEAIIRLSLDKVRDGDKFEVKGPLGISIFEYREGKGFHMVSSPCPDKICIKQGYISKKGESIVCLPNKVIITIEGKK
ncbi:MAG TPA: NusG domain II-containing protein [Dictyoglomaceae bacterium]|nr:NusG domain II-containing protein [Dictyoglomaceae bacterium]HPU44234.1 NusG domain II-containing protein [Dictyoglomaceae bacterium]